MSRPPRPFSFGTFRQSLPLEALVILCALNDRRVFLLCIGSISLKSTCMHEICPHCGKESYEVSPRFCSGCGARMNGRTSPGYSGYTASPQAQKNPMIAGICSTCLPGLGQVYNGETGKGFLFFLLTLTGLVIFLIPGIIVWLYTMYDAYKVAGKMTAGEIVFRETRMLHVVLFIVFAVILIVITLLIIVTMMMAALMSPLGPLSAGNFNQIFDTNGLF
jgi:TM2 domain-containing membrane protein YozV/ribosomal protein L37E